MHGRVSMDDLVLALAIAIWRAHGGGMASFGIFEYYRILATGGSFSDSRYVIGVDLGQSRDPTAIAIVRKVDNPTPENPVPVPVVYEPINGPNVKQQYAPGSVEYARQQR